MWRQTIFKSVLVIFTISCFISNSAWSKHQWNQLAVLTASDKELGDAFGESVSVSGDYAILGARFDDDNGEDSGSAYIFKRQGKDWIEQCKLTASDGNSFDLFGHCVSINGNYAIVGTYGSAAAYVFKRDGETWFEQCKLDVNEPVDWRFGNRVSISERYAIVSAYARDKGAGCAYIFEREAETWNLQCKLTEPVKYYGQSVAICNNYAIVGARSEASNLGAAFIYRLSENVWELQCELTGSNSSFGQSVDICQNYAIGGSLGDDENGSYSGAAFIYNRAGNTWNMQEKLIASDGIAYDCFGNSVSISGNLAIVAAYNNDKYSGSAYIFRRVSPGWQEVSKIASSNPLFRERFGTSVSISGKYAVVGTIGTELTPAGPIHGDEYKYGRAYIFTSRPVHHHFPRSYYVSDLYGDDNNDGLSPQTPFKTIQKGIDTAEDGDIVIVEPGSYKGPGNRDIDFNGKAITVRSTDPNDPDIVASTIVDCNGSETDPHRGFFFHSQEELDSVLDGFTIINGYVSGCGEAEGGGGIFIYNSSPTISNCIIKYNHIEAEWASDDFFSQPGGGGIYIAGDSPVIKNCAITENSTGYGGYGAGISCVSYYSYAAPTIQNCIIAKNDATGWHGQGGGIYCGYGSTLTAIDCTINENFAQYGGGMGNYRSSPNITNCTFTGNSAEFRGGGIFNRDHSSPIITGCTFNENSAAHGGSGIYNYDDSSMTIVGCIFNSNSANDEYSRGGGIYNSTVSNFIVINSIFIANAAAYGGGIYSAGKSESSTYNCTFTENLATNGSAIACDLQLLKLNISNCIIRNGVDWLWTNGNPVFNINYSNIEGGWPGLGNIDCDPCFVENGYWDTNGTPDDANDDFWIDGDYHLKSEGWRWDTDNQIWMSDDITSPCIDAGNPGSLLVDEFLTIPLDPNNEWGINKRINMGCYGGTVEASMPPYDWALLADLNNDGTVNLEDFGYFSNYWRSDGNDLPADFDRNKTISPVDLQLFIEHRLQTTSWY